MGVGRIGPLVRAPSCQWTGPGGSLARRAPAAGGSTGAGGQRGRPGASQSSASARTSLRWHGLDARAAAEKPPVPALSARSTRTTSRSQRTPAAARGGEHAPRKARATNRRLMQQQQQRLARAKRQSSASAFQGLMRSPLGSIQPAMLPAHQHAIDRALRSNAGAQKGIGTRSEPLLIKRRSNAKQEKEQWTKTPELDAGPSIARTHGVLVGYCFAFSIDFVTFGFIQHAGPSIPMDSDPSASHPRTRSRPRPNSLICSRRRLPHTIAALVYTNLL